MPKQVVTVPLPDKPDTVAFMDGPIVLAGITDKARYLNGDATNPATVLTLDGDTRWYVHPWWRDYRTVNQDPEFRLKPLFDVMDDTYQVNFQVRPQKT